jgi:hypothetical protein
MSEEKKEPRSLQEINNHYEVIAAKVGDKLIKCLFNDPEVLDLYNQYKALLTEADKRKAMELLGKNNE